MEEVAPVQEVAGVSADASPEVKRFAILRAAARIFNEKGFHETSMADVATALGVTKPFLYYYIENKQDLLFQCSEVATKQVHDLIETSSDKPGTALEQIHYLLRMYARIMTSDFGVCLIRNTASARSARKHNKVWAGRRRMNKRLETLIAQGIADGTIRSCDPKKISFAIFGSFNWMTFWYNPEGRQDPQAIADEFFEFFLRGLAAIDDEDDYASAFVV